MYRHLLVALLLSLAALPALAVDVVEGNSGVRIVSVTLTLATAGSNFPVTGNYTTVDGTATAGDNDYIPVSGEFVIPVGEQSSEPIIIQILGDTRVEANETFRLVLSNISGGQLEDDGPFEFTILNDDVATVQVGNAQVLEGNAGTTAMQFLVALTAPPGTNVQATYTTNAGTATPGVDFQPAQGVVTFNPGETQRTVTVNIIGDTQFEPNETLTLTATVAGGSSSTGTGTILNDDARQPANLTIVSGANQSGRLGFPLPQPLVVQVTDETGTPLPGISVQWRVVSGAALLGNTSTPTDAQGRATNTVTLESAGTITIEASIPGFAVTFVFNSVTSFESRVQGPIAIPIARALDQICLRNEPVLLVACRTLSRVEDGQLTDVLERVAPQQSGAQSKVVSEIISAVTSGVTRRLSARRGGVPRFSAQQVALNIEGQSVPVGMLAHALVAAQTDAGGSGEEDVYTGWSAFVSGNLGEGDRIARDGQRAFDLKTRGFMFGVDKLFGETVLGASLNLMQLDSDFREGLGSLDTSGYALSLYGSRAGLFTGGRAPSSGFDGVHVDGAITVGRNSYEAERVVEVGGFTLLDATSENDATIFAVTGGTGFELHRGRTDFDVALSGTWSQARIDELSEEGAGPLILLVQGHEIESLSATLGLNVRSAFPVPFGTLLPTLRGELVHEFRDAARLVTARFRRDTLGTAFTIPVDRPDSNFGRVAAGLQGVFPYGYSAFVEVSQDVLRSDLHFRTLQFNVSKSF